MMTKPGGHKDRRLYGISNSPFLERAKVASYIEEVADSRQIVIFAGAGVTIDQTGMTWAGLIEKLLTDKDLVSRRILPLERAKAAARLRPVEAATVLKYAVVRRGLSATDIPISMVRKLYHPSEWNDGGLSAEVASLALDLASKGAEVVLATTNYEILIEKSLTRLWDLSGRQPALSVTVQGEELTAEAGTSGAGQIRLEYLHGRVDAHGVTDGEVAVDELDYWKLQARVSDILTELCRDRDMLIVGSSLSDVPLLAALANTVDSDQRRRIALMPVVALGIHEESDFDRVCQTVDLLQMRMAAYRVELVVPDFYGEVGQFIREVRRSIEMGPIDYGEATRSRYVHSLHSWWKAWSQQKAPFVDQAHDELVKTLALLRDVLAAHGDDPAIARAEKLRLEAWVRWHPVVEVDHDLKKDDGKRALIEKNRDLTFWASSASVLRDESVQRRIPLTLQSRYVSANALMMGKPVVWHLPPFSPVADRSKDEAGFGRWRSFFAVPIHAQPPAQGSLTVPVGVVTLSSLNARDASSIKAEVPECMAELLAGLRDVGARLLEVQA